MAKEERKRMRAGLPKFGDSVDWDTTDNISGTITEQKTVEVSDEEHGGTVKRPVTTLKTDDGKLLSVWGSAGLKTLIYFNVGAYVWISFTGWSRSAKKRKFRAFNIDYDPATLNEETKAALENLAKPENLPF